MLIALLSCFGASDRGPAAPGEDEALPDLDAELPVEVPDPTSELLLDVASGKQPPTSLLDSRRGFVWVRVQGGERVAERVCGATARARLDELQTDLERRTDRGTRDVFECTGPVCVHPSATPGDLAGSYAFQAPDGHHVLGVVVRMGDPPSSERAQLALERWVDEQLRDLTGAPCPPD